MAGWIAALVLIGLVLFWLWRLAEFRGARLYWLGAALLLGLFGYAVQGSPSLQGSPTAPGSRAVPSGPVDANANLARGGRFNAAGRWLAFADALNRAGDHQGAAQAVQNGLEQSPNNADLWVGLANALILHGGGVMNSAAELALRRASELDPDHPGPPLFFGLALAQAGRLDEAEQLWRALLERSPADAPFRADLEAQIEALNMIRAMNSASPPVERQGSSTQGG